MNRIMLLSIFTGLSLNLVVQFGFGVRDILLRKDYQLRYPLYQCLVLFLCILATWLSFVYIFHPLGFAFMEPLLLLPLSILFCFLAEKGVLRLCSRWINVTRSTVFSAYDGLVFSAAFFTLKIAGSLAEALIMALGFSLGSFLSIAIIYEINKRSSVEAVPAFLRGAPLLLISIGLLSLVFSVAAVYFLQMAGLFQ